MAGKHWVFTFTSNVDRAIKAKDAAINRALEKIGGKCETEAKKICPVDTGRLRASITHVRSTSEKDTEIVGTNVEYAPYVELGTRYQRAQPYLRPAVENHVQEYKEIVEKELSK